MTPWRGSCSLSALGPVDSVPQRLTEPGAAFAEMFGFVVPKLKQRLGWGKGRALALVPPVLILQEGQGLHSQDTQACPKQRPLPTPILHFPPFSDPCSLTQLHTDILTFLFFVLPFKTFIEL